MLIVVHAIPGQQSANLYIFITLRYVAAWIAGYALRERSEQVEAAEVRAARAEHERESAARVAVAEERSRIARELHDIVAHAVSVMVLQVGAVRHKLPDEMAEDRDALRASSAPAARHWRRCDVCSLPCAPTETKPSSSPSRDSTASTHCSPTRPCRTARRAPPRRTAVPAPSRGRPLGLSHRPGRSDERAQARRQRRRRDRSLPARRGADRGAGQRRRRVDRRRSGARARRDSRAREDLRWRDECAREPEGGFVLSTRLPVAEEGT